MVLSVSNLMSVRDQSHSGVTGSQSPHPAQSGGSSNTSDSGVRLFGHPLRAAKIVFARFPFDLDRLSYVVAVKDRVPLLAGRQK